MPPNEGCKWFGLSPRLDPKASWQRFECTGKVWSVKVTSVGCSSTLACLGKKGMALLAFFPIYFPTQTPAYWTVQHTLRADLSPQLLSPLPMVSKPPPLLTHTGVCVTVCLYFSNPLSCSSKLTTPILQCGFDLDSSDKIISDTEHFVT